MKNYRYLILNNLFRRGLFFLILIFICSACTSKQDTPQAMSHSEFLLHQGTEALRRNEFVLALALTDSAGRIAPNNANVQFLRARIYSELGRFEKAEEAYLSVLRIEPGYRGVWNNLGNNAYRQQEYERAIAYYQKEIEANADSPIAYRGMGRAYVELGKVDSAQYVFKQAIALDSLYAPAYLDLSLLLEDEGEFAEAFVNAQRTLQIKPDELEYRYLVGSLLVKTGRPEEALDHLRAVAQEWPWHHGAHYNLGQALARLGRQDEAKTHLDRAENVRALDAKIEHLENTIRALPNDPFAHAALGFALRRAGRYNDAMHAYKVALHLEPRNVEIRNNIANLCLILGDTTMTINHYRAILQEDSTEVNTWLNLGVVYAMSKEFDKARKAWLNALNYEPNHPMAKAYLARLEETPDSK